MKVSKQDAKRIADKIVKYAGRVRKYPNGDSVMSDLTAPALRAAIYRACGFKEVR